MKDIRIVRALYQGMRRATDLDWGAISARLFVYDALPTVPREEIDFALLRYTAEIIDMCAHLCPALEEELQRCGTPTTHSEETMAALWTVNQLSAALTAGGRYVGDPRVLLGHDDSTVA